MNKKAIDLIDKHAGGPCGFCGRLWHEHESDRPESAPVPRVPCLLLKSNFIAKLDMTPPPIPTEEACKCHYQCGCDKGKCNCYSLKQTEEAMESRPRRFGKSTLVENSFLAYAKAGKSVKYEHPDYVAFSRKSLEQLLTTVKEETKREMVEEMKNEVLRYSDRNSKPPYTSIKVMDILRILASLPSEHKKEGGRRNHESESGKFN